MLIIEGYTYTGAIKMLYQSSITNMAMLQQTFGK